MMHALIERVDDPQNESVQLKPERLDTMDLTEVEQMLQRNASLGVVRDGMAQSSTVRPKAAADDEATVPIDDGPEDQEPEADEVSSRS